MGMNRELAAEICAIGRDAAVAVMSVYQSQFTIEHKADATPVTDADKKSHDIIVSGIEKLTPDVAIISEESHCKPAVSAGQSFWLVDPLDGTKSFIAKDGQFTINIALIENNIAVLGVLLLPAQGGIYVGIAGDGAYFVPADLPFVEAKRIATRTPNSNGYDVMVSKAHESPLLDEWLAEIPIYRKIRAGSALKFARIAEGKADIYPRLGATMEWDTAAGQAVVEAAGGYVCDLAGNRLCYGKSNYRNEGFVASGTKLSLKKGKL